MFYLSFHHWWVLSVHISNQLNNNAGSFLNPFLMVEAYYYLWSVPSWSDFCFLFAVASDCHKPSTVDSHYLDFADLE